MLKLSKFYVKLTLVSDNSGPKYLLLQPNQVAKFGREQIGNLDRECFLTFSVDSRNRVVGWEMSSIGSLNASLVHPREIFKAAILHNAASVIFLHNHPTGNLEPSRDDKEITKRLVEAGQILGIAVLDHVIVSQTEEFSFKDKGLL